MDPLKVVQRELEEIERGLREGTISGSVDVTLALGRKAAYTNLLWLLEGRDPSLCSWTNWKNREEARYEHNRRITRDTY